MRFLVLGHALKSPAAKINLQYRMIEQLWLSKMYFLFRDFSNRFLDIITIYLILALTKNYIYKYIFCLYMLNI